MNCPTCDADNLTDYPVCPSCSKRVHFTNRTDCRCDECYLDDELRETWRRVDEHLEAIHDLARSLAA